MAHNSIPAYVSEIQLISWWAVFWKLMRFLGYHVPCVSSSSESKVRILFLKFQIEKTILKCKIYPCSHNKCQLLECYPIFITTRVSFLFLSISPPTSQTKKHQNCLVSCISLLTHIKSYHRTFESSRNKIIDGRITMNYDIIILS